MLQGRFLFPILGETGCQEGARAQVMFDTIVFDAEGVVIDTESIWDIGQMEFLQRRGFIYDRERLKPLLTGRSLADGVRIMQQEYGFGGDVEAGVRERIAIVREIFEQEVQFIDGFSAFFARARGLYKTCIATAMAEDLLRLVDHKLALSWLFSGHIFSLADVGHRAKPDPALFLYAASQLQAKPENCLVIEDAPLGIEAARNAGMQCIGLATTYHREQLSEADLVASAYSEIDFAAFERGKLAAK